MLSFALALTLFLDAPAPQAPAPASPVVLLSELRRHPLRYLGRPVELVFQFDGFAEELDPGPLSRFRPTHDLGFRAWSDDGFLWDPQVHDDPAPRLSVVRGSVDAAGLLRGRRYDRYVGCAVVREVFGGEPWIELSQVRRLSASIGEGALIHAGRARTLMAARRYVLAGEQFERAAAGLLPEAAKAELLRLRDECEKREEAGRRRGRGRGQREESGGPELGSAQRR